MFTTPISVSDRRNPLKQQENEHRVGKHKRVLLKVFQQFISFVTSKIS